MAILTPSALKAIFQNGYTPTEADFADVFDSFLSKLENLPASKVSGLSALIDAAVAARTGADGTDLTIVVGAEGITVQSSTGTDVVLPIASGSNPGLFSSELFNKLLSIDSNATDDQTGIEIVALLQALIGNDKLSVDALKGFEAAVDARIAQSGGVGAPGADGDSAYQIWLEAGNVGTISDFLSSLVGPVGPPGADASSEYQRTVLTSVSGFSRVEIEYEGTEAVTMTGSGGAYALNIPSGTRWKSLTLVSENPSSATSGNAISISVTNGDGLMDNCHLTVIDHDGYEVVQCGQDSNLRHRQVPGPSGQLTHEVLSIGAWVGFTLFFSR